jgi:hypothetical protein
MQAFLRFRGVRKWLPGGDASLNGVAERIQAPESLV